jgi:hypothetical protein
MRPLRLARVAAEAESLRIQYMLRRAVTRLILGVVATALLLSGIVFVHLAAWSWLRTSLAPHWVGLIFAGTDLAVAAVLFFLAARSRPGVVEREAIAVRRRAVKAATDQLSTTVLLARLAAWLVTNRKPP